MNTATNPSDRSTRYFAATYFDGDHAMHRRFHRTFRAKKMQKAKRIAMSFMPWDADRMEVVEINGHEFQQRREQRQAALADRSRNLDQLQVREPGRIGTTLARAPGSHLGYNHG